MSELQPHFGVAFPSPFPFRRRPHNPQGRRRRRRRVPWGSIAYQLSFSLFILLIIVLLAGSGWGLSEQALRGGRTRFNIFIILAAYVFMFISSVAHIWSRVLSVKRILRTMPKPYVPTKAIDLPNKVADHIMVEYSRTAVIAHISQATKGSQEGWGRPGTKWENQHFRSYILSTIPKLQRLMYPKSSGINPHTVSFETMASSIDDPAAQLLIRSYASVVDRARYARREPGESDATAVEEILEMLQHTMEYRRNKEKGGT